MYNRRRARLAADDKNLGQSRTAQKYGKNTLKHFLMEAVEIPDYRD